jgi:hypothetical protein
VFAAFANVGYCHQYPATDYIVAELNGRFNSATPIGGLLRVNRWPGIWSPIPSQISFQRELRGGKCRRLGRFKANSGVQRLPFRFVTSFVTVRRKSWIWRGLRPTE